MTLQGMPDWLGRRAETVPNRPALITGDGTLTFAQLHQRVNGRARWLLGLRVEPGARVALLAGNGRPFVEMVHAAGRAGVVLVPLNTRLTPAELAWQLQHVGARLLVFDGAHEDKARDAARRAGGVPTAAVEAQAADRARPDAARAPEPGAGAPPFSLREHIDLGAVHTIIYTSGTTGRPKGAQLTYGNHWWSAVASALNLGLHGDDRWLACLPLFHVAGLSILMRSVIYGMTAIVHDRFDAERVNRAIDEDGVTIVSVVATTLQRMLEARGRRPYPPHLRCLLAGGGPVPRPLLEECHRRGLPVVQTYGLTETASQVVTLAPDDALRKIGSAGKPLLPNELRIVPLDSRPTGEPGQAEADAPPPMAPPGQVGEIAVRGPTVTPGYFRDPEATARALRGGWFYTGDLGYVDEEGYLYVVDRRDDLIISGGENVYPAEVEAALLAHPAVREAGVFGVPDARWGQVPAAAVALREGAAVTPEELQRFVGERLARYKVPVAIYVTDELPRNAAGKLLRRTLRDRFVGGGEGEPSAQFSGNA